MEVYAFHIGRKVEEQTLKLLFVKEIPNKITVKLGCHRYPKTYDMMMSSMLSHTHIVLAKLITIIYIYKAY